MIKVKLDEKIILGLTYGTLEERIDFFSRQDIIKDLDILTIKTIFQKAIDKVKEGDDGYLDAITLLQALAYNRYKSKHKDAIADFIFDQLFNLMIEDGCMF